MHVCSRACCKALQLRSSACLPSAHRGALHCRPSAASGSSWGYSCDVRGPPGLIKCHGSLGSSCIRASCAFSMGSALTCCITHEPGEWDGCLPGARLMQPQFARAAERKASVCDAPQQCGGLTIVADSAARIRPAIPGAAGSMALAQARALTGARAFSIKSSSSSRAIKVTNGTKWTMKRKDSFMVEVSTRHSGPGAARTAASIQY